MNWGQFRAQLRRFLNDEVAGKYRWTDTMLLDYMRWSLDALCAHTAMATATSFTVTESSKIYPVPSNAYEPVNLSGMIYIERGIQQIYVNPGKYNVATRMGTTNYAFYLMPQNQINLNLATNVDDVLHLFYFSHYPYPSADADELVYPSWATAALTYRCGAHAFSPYAGRSAQIRQWGQRPDTGNPEDNPLSQQSWSYLRMWETELSAVPRQDRRNYYINGR